MKEGMRPSLTFSVYSTTTAVGRGNLLPRGEYEGDWKVDSILAGRVSGFY